MKLKLPFVFRKTAHAAVAKVRLQAELDQTYLINQLAQSQRANVRLENELKDVAELFGITK